MMDPRLPDPEPGQEFKIDRRAVAIEDALVLLCLALLWLPLLGFRGSWVTVVMVADVVTMVAVLIRRKRRIDDLFEEWRRRQSETETLGAYPGMPGVMPPRQTGPGVERPSVEASDEGDRSG